MEIDSLKDVDFDELYEENVSIVYRTALYYSENAYIAEEITQDVFVKLYINRENINAKAVSTWLVAAAKNMARNYKRDCWHEILEEEPYKHNDEKLYVDSAEEQFMTELYNREHRRFTESIFDDLYQTNKRWYDAVTISYLLEKPQKEVAENMGVSLEVLHSMLYRAKKWVQKKYREKYEHRNDV